MVRALSITYTSVIGALNKIPSMALKNKSVSMFFATAQGIMKTTASPRVTT